jgi:hypothetical protein
MNQSFKHCEWEFDNEEGFYDTGCGEGFNFECEGILENNFSFCPYCGRRIKEIKENETINS